MVRHAKKQKEISHQQDKLLTPSSNWPLTPNNIWLIDTDLRLPNPSLMVPVWESAYNSNNGITLVNLDHPVVLPSRIMRDAMLLYMSSQNAIV